MQTRWYPCPRIGLEPIDVDSLTSDSRDDMARYERQYAAIGFEDRGTYELHRDSEVVPVRFFQSTDGAVLGQINESGNGPAFEFASVLEDGTYVRSIPSAPVAPWNCCRFPVHVVFGPGCGVEDLLIRHLNGVAELEQGCGTAHRYEAHRLEEVVTYLHDLVHETIYAQDAPIEELPIPVSMGQEQLVGS